MTVYKWYSDKRAGTKSAAIIALATNAYVDIDAGDTTADKFLIFNTS